MPIDVKFIYGKIKEREDEIVRCVEGWHPNIFSEVEAAMRIDRNAPITTNRKMLEEAGYTVKRVTYANSQAVILALSCINVTVELTGNKNRGYIARTLNLLLDEPVTCVWGGNHVKEIVVIH